eukprot:CAMPEP_0117680528 /NCGR_PEP_ID=MMETSP0804-20121206/18410_1 /TAXON_ID=1074897 /ORGANISM="Tetraselmis astigmatica, Strain CCMP880" /LENGTH=1991 /DNA_ID=CAMNT_0005490051 /DNA_START=420 /DNA_END=6397 /DNA_ORIENTATION=-
MSLKTSSTTTSAAKEEGPQLQPAVEKKPTLVAQYGPHEIKAAVVLPSKAVLTAVILAIISSPFTAESATDVATVSSEKELREAVLGGATEIVLNSTVIHLTTFIGPEAGEAIFPIISNTSLSLSCGLEDPEEWCELQAATPLQRRFFTIGYNGSLELEGIILRDGAATSGGAMMVTEGGRAGIYNSKFINNTSTAEQGRGGAVYIGNGTVLFDTVLFLENGPALREGAHEMYGGAVFVNAEDNNGPHLVCRRCKFQGNTARYGGAIALVGRANVQLRHSNVTANKASAAGGALWAGQSPDVVQSIARLSSPSLQGTNLTVSDTLFLSNEAQNEGGAALFKGLNTWGFTRCEFRLNKAEAKNPADGSQEDTIGGAIRATGHVVLRLYAVFQSCLFSENSADKGGSVGISDVLSGSLAWNNCTFNGSLARQAGGAVWLHYIRTAADFYQCSFEFCKADAARDGVGGAMAANQTKVRLQGSTLQGNSAAAGGAIWASGLSYAPSDLDVQDSTMVTNNALRSGGAVHVELFASITAARSTFNVNGLPSSSELLGGAIAVVSARTAKLSSIEDCHFEDNYAKHGGAVLVAAQAYLFRCRFEANLALQGGALKVQGAARLSVTDTKFLHNIAMLKGGGADVVKAMVEFKRCEFTSNRAWDGRPNTDELGGGLHVSESTKALSVTLNGCRFTDNHATYGGGVYLGGEASLRMDDGAFLGNSAEKMGGAVRLGALASEGGVLGGATAEFSGVTFANHTASSGAGAIDVWGSRAKLSHCTFEANRAWGPSGEQWGGAVRIQEKESEVDFDSCDFTNNSATYGGAVFAGLGSGVLLTKCRFSENHARFKGGGIRVESAAEVMAYECYFNQQSAEEGGALSALGPPHVAMGATTLWVRSSTFMLNHADASGGAISAVGSTLFLKANKFLYNNVRGLSGQGGGAFALKSVDFAGQVVKGQMTFEDDEFNGHKAHTGGTGVVTGAAHASFVQATLRNSSAHGEGGGIFAAGEDVQLNFVFGTFADNSAGYWGGGLVVSNGGKVYLQGTSFVRCTAGLPAAELQGSEREADGAVNGSIQQLGSDGRPLPTPAARRLATVGLGGAVFLSNNSIAVFERQCELVNNSVVGNGGAIGAVDSQVVGRQTLFAGNKATGGGGAVYSLNSKVMLLGGPRFERNAASAQVVQQPGRRKLLSSAPGRRMLRVLQLLPEEAENAGGGIHFAGKSRGVCEQCEFDSNSARAGADVYIGPEVNVGDVALSTRRINDGLLLHPPGTAYVAADSCWPLKCSLVEGSKYTTTCGVDAIHKAQLTRGTSSVGYAESVVLTTRLMSLQPPPLDECVRDCQESEVLLKPPQRCSALDPPPSDQKPPVAAPPSPPLPPPLQPPQDPELPPSPPPIGTAEDANHSPPLPYSPGLQDSAVPDPPPDVPSKYRIILIAGVTAFVALLGLGGSLLSYFCFRQHGPMKWRPPAKAGFPPRSATDAAAKYGVQPRRTTSEDPMLDNGQGPSEMTTTSSTGTVQLHLSELGKIGKEDSLAGTGFKVQVHAGSGRGEAATVAEKPSLQGFHHTQSVASQLSGECNEDLRPQAPLLPPELQVDWQDVLGAGGYGQVFRGRWTPCGADGSTLCDKARDVAVKVMTPTWNEKERLDKIRSFEEEAGMMGRFRGCEGIVEMIAADVSDSSFCWIVYELLPNGTLAERIHDPSQPRFSLLAMMRIALDIAKGLETLHAVSVVHRDLKPGNLLLDHNFRPKLIDFGISRLRDSDKTSITTECVGTWSYMAPEQFSNRVSEKVDVYALGVTIWEVFTRQKPWQEMLSNSPWELIYAIMNNDERLPIPPECPEELRSLLEDCWLADPRQRPTMSQVVGRLQAMVQCMESGKRPPGRSSSMGALPVLEDPRLAAVVHRLNSKPSSPALSRSGSGIALRKQPPHALASQVASRLMGCSPGGESHRRTKSARDLAEHLGVAANPPGSPAPLRAADAVVTPTPHRLRNNSLNRSGEEADQPGA